MSEIKLKRIISFTSEDDVHKAENLLNHGGKWLCAKKTDQTKHSVTIQLEKETKIRQVNIENEFSAFVEVWIGPEGAKSDDDFKTLLEATSFMTPGDSKNSTNGNRLKIFTNESLLNKAACELDSSVVKILCTQPFNKDLQFGIGSIKLFDKVNNDDVKDAAKLNTGVFSLKKELSDSKPVPSSPKVEPKKVVEEEEEKKPSPAKESLYDKWKKTNKTATAYDSSDDDKEDKADKKTKKSDDESKPTTSSAARNSDSKPGRRSNEEKPGNGANSILRGVIFALSGFVNPLRGEIRDKGMKLGAKYRPDWTDDCTHLVTAFSNTPKVKQVKKAKKGAIVTKDWIYECEKAGKRLDANDYEVASDSDSSDDDDDSKPRRAAKVAVAKIAKMKKRDELLDSDEEEEEAENSDDRDFIVGSDEEEEDDDVSESESKSDSSSSSSDEDRKKKKKRKKANKKKEKKLSKKKTASKRPAKKDSSSSSSSSDSESDLEKYKKKKESEIKKQKQKKMKKDDKEESNDDKENLKKEAAKKPTDLKKSASSSSSKTVVNSDMEENGDDSASWKLPTFFDEKIFFIVPDYDAKKRKALSRIIYAYGGNVSDYMSDEVDYVITDKQWDKDFDEALKENNKLKFIESDWLNTCNSRKKLIPYQPFEIVRDL